MAPLVGPHPSQARHLNLDFLYCLGLCFAGSDSCLLCILLCRWWVLSVSLVRVFLRITSLRGVLVSILLGCYLF